MMHIVRKMQKPTHAQEAIALRFKRPTADVLRDLVADGKTDVAIAAELGISRNTVAMWLREFSIERETAAAPATA